jgi:hypothetical protein
MGGACAVKTFQFNVACPKPVAEALDAYLATLVPRPSRNFLVVDCIVEYLKKRGIPIPPLEDSDDA